MYSAELVEHARLLDRLTVGLFRARRDLDCGPQVENSEATEPSLVTSENPRQGIEARHARAARARAMTYLSAMESTVPALEARFIERLVEESRPWGRVDVVDGQILVPDWVEAQFGSYVNGDECHWTMEDIQRACAEGYKVLFEPPGVHGYDVNRLHASVPDSLIEVWWSRADIHIGCGRNDDISGFLTRVDGMGWQIFATEQ